MPIGVGTAAIIGAAGAIGAGAISYAGQKNAANTQRETSDAAIAFAKEQEAERRREWDIQTAAAKKQWDTSQANLAPYRAARLQILRKHGIDVQEAAPAPPDFSAGPPPDWKPGDPIPGGAVATQKHGSGAGSWLAAAGGIGLQGLGAGFAAAKNHPDTSTAGPPRSMIQGGAIPDLPTPDQYSRLAGLGGPTQGSLPTPDQYSRLASLGGPGTVSTSNLSNWSDWNNYFGGD